MKWYSAHLIMYFKLKDRKQRTFPVWENIVLIRARDAEDAYAKAERRGREELLGDDDSLRWGGHPARMMFAGVRKVTLCQDEDRRPEDGTEISHVEMEVASEALVRKLASGETVTVKVVDPFPDEETVEPVQRMAK